MYFVSQVEEGKESIDSLSQFLSGVHCSGSPLSSEEQSEPPLNPLILLPDRRNKMNSLQEWPDYSNARLSPKESLWPF